MSHLNFHFLTTNLLHLPSLPLLHSLTSTTTTLLLPPRATPSSTSSSTAVVSRPRRKKQPKEPDRRAENSLRLVFMEELMVRARKKDSVGVSDVIYDMVLAGIRPSPRCYHALVCSHVLNADEYGAMHSLKRELSVGLIPLQETFIAVIRLFGSKGKTAKGLEILAAMEKMKFDISRAWLVLVEVLLQSNYLEEAIKVLLKGDEGGLRAPFEMYELLIEEGCKRGYINEVWCVMSAMEAAGREATTKYYNMVLSALVHLVPTYAFSTFEHMEYGGRDFMKPDTETYNWVFQAYIRCDSPDYDRELNVCKLIGIMSEDNKRLQPNARTYALLVEFCIKYGETEEAIRHFRALSTIEGGTKVLYNGGNFGDPLSLYLRAMCRGGWIEELLEALDAMIKDNQPIPSRAMIVSRKYRTLVSSWIEPMEEEAEHGYELDHIGRYIAAGGLTDERFRWVPRVGIRLDPDEKGFINIFEWVTSFKGRSLKQGRYHNRMLLRQLRFEGVSALGPNASKSDYMRVEKKLIKLATPPKKANLKPKAASKMVVAELREELEAQGLPTDGTRNVLYQRVQKARRINIARGRPLWIPPVQEEEEEVDEELDELISRIQLQEGNIEYWRSRFLGEHLNIENRTLMDGQRSEPQDIMDDTDVTEDASKDFEDDEADDEADDEEADEEEADDEEAEVETEVDVEPTDSPKAAVVDRVMENEVDDTGPLQMIGVQMLEDVDLETTSRKSKRRRVPLPEVDDGGDWLSLDINEAIKEFRERRFFEAKDMWTLADAWNWTWEKELRNKRHRRWSQEWEVELAIKLMSKVIQLGGTPTIGDCAMILRAAIRAPLPSAFLTILQTTHSLGYRFGSPLYDEIINLCLNLGESDAAIAIVTDLENIGVTVPDETIDKVIMSRQKPDDAAEMS